MNNDPISRQAALDIIDAELDGWLTDDERLHLEGVGTGIACLPTIDPVKRVKWIPCSERLPESYERVLLTCLVEGKRYTDLATFSMDGKVWHTFLKFWDADDIEPIAWMPLPEPYKEK